jgi:PAS domain S-box-containing protein
MPSPLSAAEYRLLVENSPVMIWRSGIDAKCDYFNDTWLAFTGRTLDQEMGDGWSEGVHPEDLARCVKHYLDHFERRQSFEMEYRLRRHDGVYRWIFDRGVPNTDDSGQFVGFIGSCVDVEERRRAHDARTRHDEEELARAREFEQLILAIVSHDIRNPLNAIDGSAQLLALRAGGDQQMRTIADRISRSSARITNIVGDLLDLSQERHGGGIPIALAQTDLNVVCREVAQEIGTFVGDREIAVEGEGDGEATGRWDPHRIAQILSNLLGNAVKHGVAGEPIRVRVRSDERQALVEVHNAGFIPRDIQPRLFEPFATRGDRRHGDGLGLGLFIAQSIARAHRGELQVDSSPERGTTFRLVLPRTT